MKKVTPAASPEAYVHALTGWRKARVEALRRSTISAGALDERIKWGHLVYFANGPVVLLRAEEERVLFGFWRGQRLLDREPRLAPGGKYEMATIVLTEGDRFGAARAKSLVEAAIALNLELGDPTVVTRPRR